jgi:hypothetical protein
MTALAYGFFFLLGLLAGYIAGLAEPWGATRSQGEPPNAPPSAPQRPVIPSEGSRWFEEELFNLFGITFEVERATENNVLHRIYSEGPLKQPSVLTNTRAFLRKYKPFPVSVPSVPSVVQPIPQ